jgi:hypothetical protein
MFLSKLVILAYFRYNSAKKKEKSLDKTPNISYYSLNYVLQPPPFHLRWLLLPNIEIYSYGKNGLILSWNLLTF